MHLDKIETTRDIKIPASVFGRIIGQERAVEKVKMASRQRRHLLLVGPPGIGKSMLAQALAINLPKPVEQINVVHNPENPERPFVEVVSRQDIEADDQIKKVLKDDMVHPGIAPAFVSERLGFRCFRCGNLSSATQSICPNCGCDKYNVSRTRRRTPFSDIMTEVFEPGSEGPESEVQAIETTDEGEEEVVLYRRVGEMIHVLDQESMEKLRKLNEKKQKKVLVPVNRIPFVHATGASETELLGDVRHDPYGGHKEIGTPPYMRVVAGAIHEAHEGVLFVDELPHMEHLQNFILTAMQEKRFPITGRNASSSGSSVKVKDVPCDFLFVGACNIAEIPKILPPLRSRIIGGGYEILLDTTMPYTEKNQFMMAQFVAQEIKIDGKIPHATTDAVGEIIAEARSRALRIDNEKNALTLRLRDLGGIVRMGGDIAASEGSGLIEKAHVFEAIKEAKSIEHQLEDRYGSLWKGMKKDSVLEQVPDKGGYV